MISHRAVIFTVAVLYSLEERWRGVGSSKSFEKILKNWPRTDLHKAWNQLKAEGLLGEFSEEFTYDPLYGLTNLELCLSQVSRYLLIRMDGADFCYHIDVLDDVAIAVLLERNNVDPTHVDRAASRLNALLQEFEDNDSPARN